MKMQQRKKMPLRTRPARKSWQAALLTALSLSMVLWGTIPVGALASSNAGPKKSGSKLTSNQNIVHLLDRITFGPRPGDVERVKQMGIDKYIDLQLHPERIDDSALQSKLKLIPSLNMSTAETFEQYPAPVMIARQLGIFGQNGQPGARRNPNQTQNPSGALQPEGDPAAQQSQQSPQQADAAAKLQQKEYREQIRNYYVEHDLKPPQLLLAELQAEKIVSAVYSERQLQQVMTDFWFNHFNIYWPKGADRWLTTDYVMNAIQPHALGKFGDLLMATAKSPAMLFYLDNAESMSPDAKLPQPPRRRFGQGQGRFGQFGRRRLNNQGGFGQRRNAGNQQQVQQAIARFNQRKHGINENYGRELMELHTLGVDGGYTQKDVQEVARCFTGWTIERPQRGGQFVYRAWMHDNGQKVVLGHVIPAGGGEKDGEKVIDILAHDPHTAKFISTELCRRFVSDNPPQSLVDRVTKTYTKSDGDIRDMMRTILTSPEFNSTEALHAKIKSPFELAVSAIRALGGQTDGSPQLGQWIAKMGQPLFRYQAPTGYPDRASEWVNTGSLLERLNFAIALTSNKIRGTTVQPGEGLVGLDGDQLVKRAVNIVLDGNVSQQTLAVLNKQMKGDLPVSGQAEDQRPMRGRDPSMQGDDEMMAGPERDNGRRAGRFNRPPNPRLANWPLAEMVPPPRPVDPEVAKAFGLVLGTPEFQRR